MNYNLKIQTEMAEHIWKLAYDIYKLEWLRNRPYLQNKTEEELEQGGEIYVCFNEFTDCEYKEDKNMYIKKILNYIESVYNIKEIKK